MSHLPGATANPLTTSRESHSQTLGALCIIESVLKAFSSGAKDSEDLETCLPTQVLSSSHFLLSSILTAQKPEIEERLEVLNVSLLLEQVLTLISSYALEKKAQTLLTGGWENSDDLEDFNVKGSKSQIFSLFLQLIKLIIDGAPLGSLLQFSLKEHKRKVSKKSELSILEFFGFSSNIPSASQNARTFSLSNSTTSTPRASIVNRKQGHKSSPSIATVKDERGIKGYYLGLECIIDTSRELKQKENNNFETLNRIMDTLKAMIPQAELKMQQLAEHSWSIQVFFEEYELQESTEPSIISTTKSKFYEYFTKFDLQPLISEKSDALGNLLSQWLKGLPIVESTAQRTRKPCITFINIHSQDNLESKLETIFLHRSSTLTSTTIVESSSAPLKYLSVSPNIADIIPKSGKKMQSPSYFTNENIFFRKDAPKKISLPDNNIMSDVYAKLMDNQKLFLENVYVVLVDSCHYSAAEKLLHKLHKRNCLQKALNRINQVSGQSSLTDEDFEDESDFLVSPYLLLMKPISPRILMKAMVNFFEDLIAASLTMQNTPLLPAYYRRNSRQNSKTKSAEVVGGILRKKPSIIKHSPLLEHSLNTSPEGEVFPGTDALRKSMSKGNISLSSTSPMSMIKQKSTSSPFPPAKPRRLRSSSNPDAHKQGLASLDRFMQNVYQQYANNNNSNDQFPQIHSPTHSSANIPYKGQSIALRLSNSSVSGAINGESAPDGSHRNFYEQAMGMLSSQGLQAQGAISELSIKQKRKQSTPIMTNKEEIARTLQRKPSESILGKNKHGMLSSTRLNQTLKGYASSTSEESLSKVYSQQNHAIVRVLIVEDNPINLRILLQWFKKKGIAHEIARDGNEAVEKWKEGVFPLVLMDIQLPVKSGLEATMDIRKLERERRANVSLTALNGGGKLSQSFAPSIIVALTASSLQIDREAALSAGCNDFLTKPVQLSWLEQKIHEWAAMQALIDLDVWRRNKD